MIFAIATACILSLGGFLIFTAIRRHTDGVRHKNLLNEWFDC